MKEERMRILDMVASGKISVAEAEELLSALGNRQDPQLAGAVARRGPVGSRPIPKFFRVKVDSTSGDNVDVRIPFGLLRAGIRLSTLMPPEVAEKVNKHLSDQGIHVDLKHLKKEDLDELLASFSEMEINVDAASGETVRVFCE